MRQILGMNLVVLKAIEHLAARFLQPLGPVDVVLLVKAGAQLDEDGYVLAVFGGGAEIVHELGLAGQPVDRDADGQNVRRIGRLAHHLQERLHGS